MTTTQSISAAFPFKSRYVDVLASRMHYVDEGQGEPILFLHGNPTSSYLWRNIIPYLTPLARCIAPDLIGMGKSGKPDVDYRFFDHARYVDAFIEKLGLRNVTLVVHDWGSALGFHYARRHENNVRALAFMEAILAPAPSWDVFTAENRNLFQGFRTPEVGQDMIINRNAFIEQFLPHATLRKLTEEEMYHYREPFLEPASRKPMWRWPNEIPIAGQPADVTEVVETYNQWLQQTKIPKMLLYATPGVIVSEPVVAWCRRHLSNLTTVGVGESGHYLQEDQPDLIGTALAEWYQKL